MKKIHILIFLSLISLGSISGQTKKKVVVKSNSAKSRTTKTVNTTTINNQVSGLGTKTFNGQFSDGIAKYTYYEDPITHKYIKDGLFTYTYTGENCTKTVSGYFTKDLKTGTWNYKFTMKDFRRTNNYEFNEPFCTGIVTLVANYKNGYANGNWKEICSYKVREKYTYYDASFKCWGDFGSVKSLAINMNFNKGSIVGSVYINDEFENFTAKGSYDDNSMCIGTWIINKRNETLNYELIYKDNILYEAIPRDNSGNIRNDTRRIEKFQKEYDDLLKAKSLSLVERENLGISIDTICGEHCSATVDIFEYYRKLFNRQYFLYDGIDGDLSYNESFVNGNGFTGFHGGCELKVTQKIFDNLSNNKYFIKAEELLRKNDFTGAVKQYYDIDLSDLRKADKNLVLSQIKLLTLKADSLSKILKTNY